jgi:hypothetical protein
MLTPILITKMINFGVNKFHLTRRVQFGYFFTLTFPKKPDLNLESFFLFRVNFEFLCSFLEL